MTVDDAVAMILRAAREPAPVGDPDPPEGELETAVRALAVHELALLWQRFLPHVQAVLDRRGDHGIAERLVLALLRGCADASPSPLVAEPRIVDLAARVRHHESLGAAARALLAAAPRTAALAAIERYPLEPVLPRVPVPGRGDYLARYLGGERGVWNELVEQAVAIAQHAELRAEATTVAVELMKRVRHNTDAVRAVLREAGARLTGEPATADDAELARIAAVVGPIPIALDAFWRVVGSIRFSPAAGCALESDGLVLAALEPLAVPAASELAAALARHEQAVEASHREIVGPFALALAHAAAEVPPAAIEARHAAEPPRAVVELPPSTAADAIDPRVHHARHRLRFVEYLRHAFRWGGFAALGDAPRGLARDRDAIDRMLARLRVHLVDL